MYVNLNFREKIGHALVLKSIEIARGLGATQMLLNTPPHEARAQAVSATWIYVL